MSKKGFNRPWLSLTIGLLVVLTATISAAKISVGSAGYLGLFIDLPRRWSVMLVVLSMGLVAIRQHRVTVLMPTLSYGRAASQPHALPVVKDQ